MEKCSNDDRNRIRREEMYREGGVQERLDYETPWSRHPHTLTHGALIDWKAVAASMGRQKFHLSPEITLGEVGGVAVVQDDGSLTLDGGEINYMAVWDLLRAKYGDSFDFVTFFADSPVPFSYSFWSPIYAKTEGIGGYNHDVRSAWGTERLQGFHFINSGHVDNMGVYLQEFGHQWGSYTYFADAPDSEWVYTNLLLDGEPGHWDFLMDDGHSPMNYDFQFTPFMSTHWQQRQGDGSLFDFHATERIEYCDLDLYLMGLLEKEKVEPFYYIAGADQVGSETYSGAKQTVTIDEVINAMGPRNAPVGLRENNFRNLWVLVTSSAQLAVKTAAHIDDVRQSFELHYTAATRCLGHVDTTLPD